MRVILFVLAGLAFLAGAGIFSVAESAIHEIEAFMLFLISAVFISGAAVVEAIIMISKKIDVLADVRAPVNKAESQKNDTHRPSMPMQKPRRPQQATSPSDQTVLCPVCSHPIGLSSINVGRNTCPRCKSNFEAEG